MPRQSHSPRVSSLRAFLRGSPTRTNTIATSEVPKSFSFSRISKSRDPFRDHGTRMHVASLIVHTPSCTRTIRDKTAPGKHELVLRSFARAPLRPPGVFVDRCQTLFPPSRRLLQSKLGSLKFLCLSDLPPLPPFPFMTEQKPLRCRYPLPLLSLDP